MKRWVVVKDERECGDLRSSKVVVEDKRDNVLTLRNQTMSRGMKFTRNIEIEATRYPSSPTFPCNARGPPPL